MDKAVKENETKRQQTVICSRADLQTMHFVQIFFHSFNKKNIHFSLFLSVVLSRLKVFSSLRRIDSTMEGYFHCWQSYPYPYPQQLQQHKSGTVNRTIFSANYQVK